MTEKRLLSPRGGARELFEGHPPAQDPIAALFGAFRKLADGHDLSASELHLAEELVGLLSGFRGEREREALAFAVLASTIAVREGSTRLSMEGGARGPLGRRLAQLAAAAGTATKASALLKTIRELAQGVYFGRLIGAPGESRPLICDGEHLYQHRHHSAEVLLAARLQTRLAMDLGSRDEARAAAIWAAERGPVALSSEQCAAVELALAQPLAILTGGPGTGKTMIAAALLRAAHRLGVAPGEMAIAAPTGKATRRLADSLARGLAGDSLSDQLPPPQTLHRLLGYRPSGGFRHHDNHPLGAKLVVVDEASMIDLQMMERLLAALPDTPRLVLLGDADQLPSVEAGAAFRDLVEAGRDRFAARLQQSFRMDPSRPEGRAIYQLSRAILDGDGKALDGMPRPSAGQVAWSGVEWLAGDSGGELGLLLDRWLDRLAGGVVEFGRRSEQAVRCQGDRVHQEDEARVTELLRELETGKILTATRTLSTGSAAIAERVHVRFRSRLGRPLEVMGPGEPVMVTGNDYRRGLFNGDSGVCVRADRGDGAVVLRLAFATDDGIKLFPVEALRGLFELGHAITVHRSQGSEWHNVLLLMPEIDIPLLTRELLYTAVTRARDSVTLVGAAPRMRTAMSRATARDSGLVERLHGA